MFMRFSLSAALLVGALTFLAADDAQAGSLGRAAAQTGLQFGPRIHVGVGVTVPIGRSHYRRSYRREVVEYVGGYHETRTREVRVPGEQIGWDLRGRAIYARDRIEVRGYQVWIPRRRVVRRSYRRARGHRHHHHPVGHIRVGGRVRIR